MNIKFEWDAQNATDYFKKHKVRFELAAHTVAETGRGAEVIRIVSARKAD